MLNISLVDFPIEKLKEYAEFLEEKIERLPQIKAVDIRGIQEFEVEVAVDIYKMTASKISLNDVIKSIQDGNNTISSGSIIGDGKRRNVRLVGEIESPKELENFVIKSDKGAVYLRKLQLFHLKKKILPHMLDLLGIKLFY